MLAARAPQAKIDLSLLLRPFSRHVLMILRESERSPEPLLLAYAISTQNLMSWLISINPFMPNRISLSYKLDQPIFLLRVVGWYFPSLLKF